MVGRRFFIIAAAFSSALAVGQAQAVNNVYVERFERVLGGSNVGTAALAGLTGGGQRRRLPVQVPKAGIISQMARSIVARTPKGLAIAAIFTAAGYFVDFDNGSIWDVAPTDDDDNIEGDGYCVNSPRFYDNDAWPDYNGGLVTFDNRPSAEFPEPRWYVCHPSSRSAIIDRIISAVEDSEDRFNYALCPDSEPTINRLLENPVIVSTDYNGNKINVLFYRVRIEYKRSQYSRPCDHPTTPGLTVTSDLDMVDYWPAGIDTPPGHGDPDGRLSDDEILEKLSNDTIRDLIRQDLRCYRTGSCTSYLPWDSWLPNLLPGVDKEDIDDAQPGDFTAPEPDISKEDPFEDFSDYNFRGGSTEPEFGITPYDLGVAPRTCPVNLGTFLFKIIPSMSPVTVALPSDIVCTMADVMRPILIGLAWVFVIRLIAVAL